MTTMPRTGMTNPNALEFNAWSGTQKVQAEGRCRMCGRTWEVRPLIGQQLTREDAQETQEQRLTRHHLVPQSWFRSTRGSQYRSIRNANANIVPLCRPCHDLIEEPDMISRRMLRRALTQQEIAFVVRYRGKDWLDYHYPP